MTAPDYSPPKAWPAPRQCTAASTSTRTGQFEYATQQGAACSGHNTEQATVAANPNVDAPAPGSPPTLDQWGEIATFSQSLDEVEALRLATNNRAGALARDFGLGPGDPTYDTSVALAANLKALEDGLMLTLRRAFRRTPYAAWAKPRKGIGERQIARLLGTIGDPYLRTVIAEDKTVSYQPRKFSQLRAYCGYHNLPVGHSVLDAQRCLADGNQPRVAARRQRGQRANWNPVAKSRAFLIAESCLKQGDEYRAVYDEGRYKYADATHATECAQCGPKGKPAQPGSDLSDGHKHARALRLVAKEILRDLWIEGRRIHNP